MHTFTASAVAPCVAPIRRAPASNPSRTPRRPAARPAPPLVDLSSTYDISPDATLLADFDRRDKRGANGC